MQLRPWVCVIATLQTPFLFAASTNTDMPPPAMREEMVVVGVRPGSPNDITFTGAKTRTPLKDLPAAVVVVPMETLKQQGAIDMNSALVNASGVQPLMAGGYGFADNYTIRGLAMRFLRDGLPDGTSQNGYSRVMYDVDRIEVLKGPGSALYGSGQPGGSVNVVSKAPRPTFGAEIGAMAGSFGTYGTHADVWGALDDNEKVVGRVIVDHEHRDGFRDLEREVTEFLPTLQLKIADDKVLTLDYDHRKNDIVPDNYGIIFDTNQRIAGVDVESKYSSPMNFAEQTIDRLTAAHDWTISSALSMRTALIYDQRDLSMLRNAGGNGGNAANAMTGRNIRTQDDDMKFLTAQNEIVWDMQTGSIEHTLLGGIEYSDTDISTVRVSYNLPNIVNIYAPVVPETTLTGIAPVAAQGFNRDLSQTTLGVYLQDQLAFGNHWKLRLGVRSDRVDANDEGMQGTNYRELDVDETMNSGNAGIVWQPLSNLSLYAGYSTGKFENVATESTAIPLKPESAQQKEIGMKAVLFGGKADLNLAVFDTEREDYFITLPGALSPTPDGHDRTRGVDLDAGMRPLEGFSVQLSLLVQDPEVQSSTLASNTVVAIPVINRSIAGTQPTGVAKHSGNVWATYDFQAVALQGWGIGLGARYKGESYADSLNLYRVPAYTVWDSALFYRADRWQATLNLRNLTDKTYYTNPTFSGALPGEERNLLLSMVWSIGE